MRLALLLPVLLLLLGCTKQAPPDWDAIVLAGLARAIEEGMITGNIVPVERCWPDPSWEGKLIKLPLPASVGPVEFVPYDRPSKTPKTLEEAVRYLSVCGDYEQIRPLKPRLRLTWNQELPRGYFHVDIHTATMLFTSDSGRWQVEKYKPLW
jgi:hypothetical protein